MKARHLGPIALVLALALALGGCADDGSSTSAKSDPFGNAAGTPGNTSTGAVNRGTAGTTGSTTGATAGTGGTSASAAGTSGGPEMPGAMPDGGAMKPPMKERMKPGMVPGMPDMMEGMMPGMMEMPALVCPATAPMNDTPCTAGRGMCAFGTLKCRCKKEGWSCETVTMAPDAGEMPMP